ncbi:MAG: hypothetical protein MK538_06415 [Planctomycetes bacterium]|nr:hypothetical protein [Planctomycetota bacterium]
MALFFASVGMPFVLGYHRPTSVTECTPALSAAYQLEVGIDFLVEPPPSSLGGQ